MPNRRICLFKLVVIAFLSIEIATAQSGIGKSFLVLSGLQMTVTNDIKVNQVKILNGIQKAALDSSDFLVTPEGSLSGYTNDFNQRDLAIALEEIIAEARKLKVGIMLGTCYKELIGGKEFCFNQVRVYGPDGLLMGSYSKILRCSSLDIPGSGEIVDYVEGELMTFDWNGLRFGILICNDLWPTPGYTTMPNPYLPWKLKQMGVQLIIHCINSGTTQKYRPFHESSAELWAFATHIPIFEVNAAHGNEMINAQSGLINKDGERSLKVPETGDQYFSVKISIPIADL